MKPLLSLAALAIMTVVGAMSSPAAAQFSVGITVNFAPPALPVYDQPPIPAPDYIWVPGYWAWDGYVQDYFWVPGTWLQAPRPGLLWTPAWWGWQEGAYMFHPGYWGPHVGFYGGVPYGFGYTGTGYQGAYWNGGHVFYNQSVTNVTNVHITNVYNKTVIVNQVTNVSYNGGPGGIQARPSSFEQAAMREPHIAQTPVQQQHLRVAHANRQLFASINHGRPAIAATARPAMLTGPGLVPTRQAVVYHPPSGSPRPALPPAGPRPDAPQHTSTADMSGRQQMRPAQRPFDAQSGHTQPMNDDDRSHAQQPEYLDDRQAPPPRTDGYGYQFHQPHPVMHQDGPFAREQMSPPHQGQDHPPAPPHDRPPPRQPAPPHPQGGHPKPPSEHHEEHHG